MEPLRAVLYLRQSFDPFETGAAVDRQRADCMARATAHDWTVVDEYVDNDISATARRRPGLEAMLSAAAAGAFDVVVVWHVDRLVRRLADLEPLLATFEATGIQIATATGDLDPRTDAGRLVARILSSVAQAEVERKGIRQRRANRQRAEQGHVRLVRRPFGYDMRGLVNRKEAHALRRAAAQYIAGRSAASIARDLNARGILTSTGSEWRGPSLLKVLTNPRYAGFVTYHGVRMGIGSWTPLLSMDVHEAVVRIASDPSRRIPQQPARKHLLTGIARCGLCNSQLESNKDGRTGRRIYRCPRLHLSRRMDLVDALVVDAALLAVRQAGDSSSQSNAGCEEDLASMRQVRNVKARIREASVLFSQGLIDKDGLIAVAGAARRQLVGLEQQYAIRTRQHALSLLLRGAAVGDGQKAMRRRWDALTIQQQREVVSSLLIVRVLPSKPGRHFQPERIEVRARER